MLQTFSAESVCFKHKDLWTVMRNSTTRKYGISGGGCYRVLCVTYTKCLQFVVYNIKIINIHFVFTLLQFYVNR